MSLSPCASLSLIYFLSISLSLYVTLSCTLLLYIFHSISFSLTHSFYLFLPLFYFSLSLSHSLTHCFFLHLSPFLTFSLNFSHSLDIFLFLFFLSLANVIYINQSICNCLPQSFTLSQYLSFFNFSTSFSRCGFLPIFLSSAIIYRHSRHKIANEKHVQF